MHKCKIQRRCVTLIEMMIVMFLIALITGIVAYNYQGSLDEGKVFKTTTAIDRLETILNLEISKNPQAADQIESNWEAVVRAAPLVKDPNNLIFDGWGQKYSVSLDRERGGVRVTSGKLEEYQRTHQTLIK